MKTFLTFDECLAIQYILMLRKKMITLRLCNQLKCYYPNKPGVKYRCYSYLGKANIQKYRFTEQIHQNMIIFIIKQFSTNKRIFLRVPPKHQAPLVHLNITQFAHQFSEAYSLWKGRYNHITACTQPDVNSQHLGQCLEHRVINM